MPREHRSNLNSNPYASPQPAKSHKSRMAICELNFFSRPLLILLWILTWCALAVLFFSIENLIEPFPKIDYWFFLRLHFLIGLAAGGLTWYVPRLVLQGKTEFRIVFVIALLFYAFLIITSLDQNPPVSIFITILLLALLGMAALATHCRVK